MMHKATLNIETCGGGGGSGYGVISGKDTVPILKSVVIAATQMSSNIY